MASSPSNAVVSDTFSSTVSSSITDNTITVTPPSPRRLSPLQNLSPSILIIVTVLSVTVIVSIALCFILRHLNRRCLRRLSSDSSTTATPIFTSGRRVAPEIAPSVVIDSLPLFSFSSVTRRSSGAAADCAVCLSKFQTNDQLRLLPLCCHAFHAECIDTWLRSNLSCPLCRSAIFAADSDLAKILRTPSCDSFRVEIGNVSRRETNPNASGSGDVRRDSRSNSRSYSIGSFEYFVEEESEIPFSQAHRRSVSDQKDIPTAAAESTAATNEAALAGEVGGVRNWLKDYVDRVSASISSRTASFRSSGRFLSGRSDVVPVAVEYDVEGNRIGEEISEMFRWLSGV